MATRRKKHWSYKTCNSTGPGPAGRQTRRRDEWDCNCRQVNEDTEECQCDSIGRTKSGRVRVSRKKFRINLRKKRAYMKKYRDHVKRVRKGRRRSCPGD